MKKFKLIAAAPSLDWETLILLGYFRRGAAPGLRPDEMGQCVS